MPDNASDPGKHLPLPPHPLLPSFHPNRLPPFTRQSIWEIFQVVKRISGTFGWLCHDEPQSEWAWSQPSLIPPPLEPHCICQLSYIADGTYAACAAAN